MAESNASKIYEPAIAVKNDKDRVALHTATQLAARLSGRAQDA